MAHCVNPNNPEFQEILKRIDNPLLAELEFDRLYSSENIKEGVDFVFEQTPELSSIGTKEQYSEYLDGIFPESKVKRVLFHGSSVKIQDAFKDNYDEFGYSSGIFFTDNIEYLKEFAKNNIEKDTSKITSVIINAVDNFQMKEEIGYGVGQEWFFEQYDSIQGKDAGQIVEGNVYAVRNNKQIYILGSKNDIKGFKDFIKNKQNELSKSQPTSSNERGEEVNIPEGFKILWSETVAKNTSLRDRGIYNDVGYYNNSTLQQEHSWENIRTLSKNRESLSDMERSQLFGSGIYRFTRSLYGNKFNKHLARLVGISNITVIDNPKYPSTFVVNDKIVININKNDNFIQHVIDNSNIGDEQALLDTIIAEELIHLVSSKVSTQDEEKAAYKELTNEDKVKILQSYTNDENRIDTYSLTDRQYVHEYVRMQIQKKVLGATTEEKKTALSKIIDKVWEYLKDLLPKYTSLRSIYDKTLNFIEKGENVEKPLLQKEGTESSKASPQVMSIVKNLLQKIGVNWESVSSLEVNGRKIGGNGVAKIMQALAQVIEGKENVALPEETMHFVVEIIKHRHPELYKQLMKEISSYQILNLVFKEYGTTYTTEDGKPDVIKLKEEAIAKLLVEVIINKTEGLTEYPDLLLKVRMNWWDKIVNFFRNLFYSSGIDKTAIDIISGKFEGNIEDVKSKKNSEKVLINLKQKELLEQLHNTIISISTNNNYQINDNEAENIYNLLNKESVDLLTIEGINKDNFKQEFNNQLQTVNKSNWFKQIWTYVQFLFGKKYLVKIIQSIKDQRIDNFFSEKGNLTIYGITNNQKTRIPTINKLLYKTIVPSSYDKEFILRNAKKAIFVGRNYNDFIKTIKEWNKIHPNSFPKWTTELTEEQYNKRDDAWLLSNGLPQKHNTFRYIGRGYVNSSGELIYNENGEDIYGFVNPVFDSIDINKKNSNDVTNFVMGHYALFIGKDETGYYIQYNDRWDLDVANIKVQNIIDKTQKPFIVTGKIYKAIEYDDNGNPNIYYTHDENDLNIAVYNKFIDYIDDVDNGREDEEDRVFYQLSKQDGVFNKIKETSKAVTKDEEGYIVAENRVSRVHDILHSWYDKIKNELTKSEFQTAVDDIYKESGTKYHSYFEEAFKTLVDGETGLLRETTLEDDPTFFNNLSTIDADFYTLLKNNLRERLLDINSDSKDGGGTKFLAEAVIFDPNRIVKGKKGLAGTMDFISISKDGKVRILDWKFMTLNTDRYTDIPWYKRDEWNQQMTQYKLILQRAYDIKAEDFIESRMIPVQMIYTKPDYKKNTLPRLKEMKIGSVNVKNIEQDFLLPFATSDERTGKQEIDEWIDRLNDLYAKMSGKKATSPEEKKLKADQLNQIVKTLRWLQIKQDVTPLIEQAKSLTLYIENVVKKYNDLYKGKDPSLFSEEELNNFSEELDNYSKSIAKYVHLDAELESVFPTEESKENDELKSELSKVAFKATKLSKQLDNIHKEFVAETLMKRENIDKFLTGERMIKGLVRWFHSTSLIQTKAVQFLYKKANKMLSFAGFETQEQNLRLKEIEESYIAWAIKHGISSKNYFTPIKKKNENALIDEFNPEFYKELKKAIIEKDFEWIQNNVDKEAVKAKIKESLDAEIARIKSRKIINDKEREAFEEQGILSKDMEREIKKAKELYNTSTTSSLGWLLYADVSHAPLREKWESDEWKFLNKEENAPVKAFYDYIIERNNEYAKIGYINNPRTFLPFVEKRFLERLQSGGNVAIGERFLRNISINEEDVGYGKRDPETGELIDVVPKYFTSDIEGEVSDDLFRTIGLYNDAAIRFKYITQIEKQLRSVLTVERNKRAISTSMFGKTRRENGELKYENDNRENASLYEDMMKTIIYGQKYLQSETFDQLLFKLGTWGEKLNKKFNTTIFPEHLEDRQVSVNKSVDAINNYFQISTLGLNLLSAGSNLIGGTMQSIINAGKYFTKTDWTSAQLNLATLALHTDEYKKFFAAVNYFLPLTENYNRELINDLSIHKLSPDAVQDTLMWFMRKSDRAVQLTNFYAYIQNSIVIDGKIQNVREYLKNQEKYKNKYSLTKEERKEFDRHFEEDVENLLKEHSVLKKAEYKNGRLEIQGIDRMSDSVVELRRKVQQLNKDSLGNLTEDDLRLINSTIFGKSFMLFKNWIPRPLDVRFGGMKYNSATDAMEWGRMRTVFRVVIGDWNNTINSLKSAIAGNDDVFVKQILALYEKKKEDYESSTGKEFKMTQDEFVDLVRRNIRNQLYDAIFLSILIGMVLMLKALPDDDDSPIVKNNYRFMAKAFDKFKDELFYFYDFTSFTNFVSKGFFPSMTMIENMRKAVGNFFYENWALTFGTEKQVKDNKVIKYWLKSFPFTSQMSGYIPLFYPELAKDLGIKMQSNYGIK